METNKMEQFGDNSVQIHKISGGVNTFYLPSGKRIEMSPRTVKKVADLYRDFLRYECGEIILDGLPMDDRIGSRTLELEKLFIPAKFEFSHPQRNEHDNTESAFRNEFLSEFSGDGFDSVEYFENKLVEIEQVDRLIPIENKIRDLKTAVYIVGEDIKAEIDNIDMKQAEDTAWEEYETKTLEQQIEYLQKKRALLRLQATLQQLSKRVEMLLFSLNKEKSVLIPSSEIGFFRVILAGPGGGKTTLLKRLVMAYAFPERRYNPEINDELPDRDLFPIWVRCRNLKEKANLSIVDIIKDCSLWEHGGSFEGISEIFSAIVSGKIAKGDALILFDGLDEISDVSIRKGFAEKISQFFHFNPTANILVTSRSVGFEYVSDGKLGKFTQAKIKKFDSDEIEHLCIKWFQIIYGFSENTVQQAADFIETILNHPNIKELAGSPLLLTTLLLVQRRVGRLPSKRIALYSESVKVLLETWNLEAHKRIELDSALCHLSYVAFEMINQGIQIIGRDELISILKNVRNEQSWLPSIQESPVEFLERVELRSSLLIKRGYRQTESGLIEDEYEFQHLTFQEYLAAYAVVNGFYFDVEDYDRNISVLNNFYADPNKHEFVLLAVTLATPREVAHIITSMIESVEERYTFSRTSDASLSFTMNSINGIYISIFMRMLDDETKMLDSVKENFLAVIVEASIYSGERVHIEKALDSIYESEFRMLLKQNGWHDLIKKFVDLCLESKNDEFHSNSLFKLERLLFRLKFDAIKMRLDDETLNKQIFDLLFSTISNTGDIYNLRSSFRCLLWLYQANCNPIKSNFPRVFLPKLIDMMFSYDEIDFSIRILNEMPFEQAYLSGLFWHECPDEIHDFLLSKVEGVVEAGLYAHLEGLYWACIFTRAIQTQEAEMYLNDWFSNECHTRNISKVEKLNKILSAIQ